MSRLVTRSSPDTEAGTALTAEDQYDENGVDLTLVRYTLSLSPTQRLKAVENHMKAMASVKTISRASHSE
jgi:hypothetical protein